MQKFGKIADDGKVEYQSTQLSANFIVWFRFSYTHKAAQVQKFTIAYNTAVRHCFNLSRFVSFCNVLYFWVRLLLFL